MAIHIERSAVTLPFALAAPALLTISTLALAILLFIPALPAALSITFAAAVGFGALLALTAIALESLGKKITPQTISRLSRGKISPDEVIKVKTFMDSHPPTGEFEVFKKSQTNIRHNVVRHKDGSVRIRYDSLFAQGTYKLASRQIDIDTGKIYIKGSLLLEEAPFYKRGKYKDNFASELIATKIEMEISNLFPNALRLSGFHRYKKTHGGHSILKMAVYSEERSEGHFDENFKKLTLQKKFKVFKDTLEFIGEMHCRNFVHRDIKPANIFLNKEEGGLKTYVGDFGFSREAGHIYDICGSPLYMPLDAFSTPKDYPKQHDAFSMGVLLFQILNNCNTDELDDRVADLSARHNVSFERFPDRSYFFPNEPIENTLEKLCYDLLSPSPDSRPTIPQAKERFEGLLKAGFFEDREGNR